MPTFKTPLRWFDGLDAAAIGQIVASAGDLALVFAARPAGVIKDVAFGSDELQRELEGTLAGQPWLDTVTVESRPKVEALLRDVQAGGAARWRHVNQRGAQGQDVPVLYQLHALPDGRALAVGRSLRSFAQLQQRLVEAQQAMDSEAARLRQAETRHRLLFQVSGEAVLVIDASSRRVVEANPAANELFTDGGRKLVGRALGDCLTTSSRAALEALLGAVRVTGRPDQTRVRVADGGPDCMLAAALFREDRNTFFLVRLTPAATAAPARSRHEEELIAVVEAAPDGVVVTDLDGRIRAANRAFLDLAQLATLEQARGENLERWLGRAGVDFSLLLGHVRAQGVARLFATIVRGELGSSVDVEVGCAAVSEGEAPCLGFVIRDVGPRLAAERRETLERPRSIEQFRELVGRVPLRDLVRDSTDMIERLCIEAALELTNDNRASAAEVLGLSRQSFYAKLHRYGLGSLDEIESQ